MPTDVFVPLFQHKSSLVDLLNPVDGSVEGKKGWDKAVLGKQKRFDYHCLPQKFSVNAGRTGKITQRLWAATWQIHGSLQDLPNLYPRSPCQGPGLFWEDGTADEHIQSLLSEVLDGGNTRYDLVSAPVSALGISSPLQRANWVHSNRALLAARKATSPGLSTPAIRKAWQLLGGTKAEQIPESWWNTLCSRESSSMWSIMLPTAQDKARTKGWLLKGRGVMIKLNQAVGRRWIANFHSGSLQTHNRYWKDVKATQFKRDKWIQKN